MIKNSLAVTFFIGCSYYLAAQTLSLKLLNKSVPFFTPIAYELSFLNNIDTTILFAQHWNFLDKPILEIKKKNDSSENWLELIYSDYQPSRFTHPRWADMFAGPRLLNYEPGFIEKDTFNWAFFPVDLKNEKIPFSLGAYTIRAKLKTGDTWFYSNSEDVIFRKLNKRDAAAYKFLQTLELPGFFYEIILCEDAWGYYSFVRNKNIINDAKKFLNSYPKSKFADWVKLHILLYENLDPKISSKEASKISMEEFDRITKSFNQKDELLKKYIAKAKYLIFKDEIDMINLLKIID